MVETVDHSEENLGKVRERTEKVDDKFRSTVVGYDKVFKRRKIHLEQIYEQNFDFRGIFLNL